MINDTKLRGYAEELPDNKVAFRGHYGRRIVVPMDELEQLIADFNAEVWNRNGEMEDNITLSQIDGSSGPCDAFICFYMRKNGIDPMGHIVWE